jgi:eukaryotic-like serine/threonine-protein kinase
MSEARSASGLERYKLLGTLGHGGFGTVYKAIDRATGERVAVKELTHVSPTSLAQFKKEFRAVQEVHHPNLVRLDELFQDRDKWLIAMELVEGKDLLDDLYVDDEARCFDETRLRDVFAQLSLGLSALHEAGFVHRDLKPKNVLVTGERRVVLLDFGLAEAIDRRSQTAPAPGFGTVAYMAPEQAEMRAVGPASDWYALGVCLYEAMTGMLPIDAETPQALLHAKQHARVAPPSAEASGIPPDLDQLCCALLAVDPAERPSGRSIRQALGYSAAGVTSAPPGGWSRATQQPPSTFVGREEEIEQLERALARASEGSQQIVLIEGESGIGKSALVEHFLAQLDDAIVLRSRCYENELLAYKAFDGALEQLSQYLCELQGEQCAQLLPAHAALLARLFPSLASVPSVASTPLAGISADPGAQRLEAFSVFAEMFFRLGEQKPVILTIDDLQWADAESFALLKAWLGLRRARCLIIATLRPRGELEAAVAEQIAGLRSLGCVEELLLSGLPSEAARDVTRRLTGPHIPELWVDAIVDECAGHPLFLTVLSRFAESRDPRTEADLTLDDALLSRIGSLPAKQRQLLETVALTGVPMAAPLCGRAAVLDEIELGLLVTELCRQKLLRRRRGGELSCFHDRVRRVTVQCLALDQKRELHARIAAALATQSNFDPAQLARHHEAAAEHAPALEAYRLAAERALGALAFARAASLYERAIEMSVALCRAPGERVALRAAMGHALARGGRSAEAAQQYLEAAASARGEEAIRLRTLAAVHLLQSARVAEGMAAARALLGELGLHMPSSNALTLARLLWDRACLAVHGVESTHRPARVDSRCRMRLEALWGLALPISWLDPLASAGLITRHLRLARAHGEPAHMARALAQEAFAQHLREPGHPRVAELIGRARRLCDACSDPALDMSVAFHEGTMAIGNWQFQNARERLERAHKVGSESCPDEPWLLTNVRVALGGTYTLIGEYARIATGTSAWLAEARERNDQFALSLIETIGMGHLRHLMADDPDRARDAVADALAPWPREPFSFAHYGEIFGVVHAELYRGGDGAQRWIAREWPRLSRAYVLKTPFAKVAWLHWLANAALSARNERGASSDRALDEARSWARQLGELDSKAAKIHAGMVEAQLLAIEGKLVAALDKTRACRQVASDAGNRFVAVCLQYLEGWLLAGDAGAQERNQALAFFAAQGWKQPRRAVAIMCPALDGLEAASRRS